MHAFIITDRTGTPEHQGCCSCESLPRLRKLFWLNVEAYIGSCQTISHIMPNVHILSQRLDRL
jgi:hypothetical protein